MHLLSIITTASLILILTNFTLILRHAFKMDIEVKFLAKLAIAVMARELLDALVHLTMFLEVAQLAEGAFTAFVWTQKRVLFGVGTHMIVELAEVLHHHTAWLLISFLELAL